MFETIYSCQKLTVLSRRVREALSDGFVMYKPLIESMLRSFRRPEDIGQVGEAAAVRALRGAGWLIRNWDTRAAGATDIVAEHPQGAVIRVQAKAAVGRAPAPPTPDERWRLRLAAALLGQVPYVCYVQLAGLGGLLLPCRIGWERAT